MTDAVSIAISSATLAHDMVALPTGDFVKEYLSNLYLKRVTNMPWYADHDGCTELLPAPNHACYLTGLT